MLINTGIPKLGKMAEDCFRKCWNVTQPDPVHTDP